MAVIESVYARQILDSRGNPTVEVVLDTEDGAQAWASFRPVLPPVKLRLGSVAMATSPCIRARVFSMPSRRERRDRSEGHRHGCFRPARSR